MPYEFTLTSLMPASAQEVYEAWLHSLAHSQMTGGEAKMSGEIGADVSAWDGYISGRILQLVPHARIVQSWRTTKFTAEHEDSVVTLSLEENDEGTLLTLVHSNVPDGQTSYEQGGWESHYFVPMRAYFAKRKAPARKRTATRTKPAAGTKSAARAGKSAGKPKTAKGKAAAARPSRASSKAEPRSRAAARKVAAAAKPKAAPATPKTAKGKAATAKPTRIKPAADKRASTKPTPAKPKSGATAPHPKPKNARNKPGSGRSR
jgi:uncharacterized protein YndB with AHSA1/START domain